MDSLDALFALERFGIRPGLDTIRLLVRAMGDPQSSYRTVIVAGTNGKGSVVAMADTVTDMQEVRHAFNNGLQARRGIDF